MSSPVCQTCDKSFSRLNELRRHMLTSAVHRDFARPYFCYMCNKTFTKRSRIIAHFDTVHRCRTLPPSNSSSLPESFSSLAITDETQGGNSE